MKTKQESRRAPHFGVRISDLSFSVVDLRSCASDSPIRNPQSAIKPNPRSKKYGALRILAALVTLASWFALSGCSGTSNYSDIGMYIRVLNGKASYKQACLCFERTSYDALVRNGDYCVKWREGKVDEVRSASENRSVKDTIADVTGAEEGNPTFYFLLRGIDPDETVFSGNTAEPQAASLNVVPGDLLVIDPSPNHALFSRVPDRRHSRLPETGASSKI